MSARNPEFRWRSIPMRSNSAHVSTRDGWRVIEEIQGKWHGGCGE
jgi:hypothetical protein